MGRKERHAQGRIARLRAEVFCALQGVAVNYSCVYCRTEQAKQYKRGWDSVSQVDIDAAVMQVSNNQAQLHQQTKATLHQRVISHG